MPDTPRPATMTEHEAIEYVANLYRLELSGDYEPAVLALGPATAFILISVLQLVTRHPNLSEENRSVVGRIIDQLRPLFAGTPGAALLRLGDNPDLDIPVTCRYPSGPHAPECPPGDHLGFGGAG